MCCLICLELDKMSFSEAFVALEKIPDSSSHKKEVESLIKNHFNKDRDLIRLETLRELANKYRNGKFK